MRERLFPDWDMELVTAINIRDVLLDALGEAKDAQNAGAVISICVVWQSGYFVGLSQQKSAKTISPVWRMRI